MPHAAAVANGSFSGLVVSQRSSTAQTSAQAPLARIRHLHSEHGFADAHGADAIPDTDDDPGEIAARCHRPIGAWACTDGNSPVEGPLGHVNIVDVDAGREHSHTHLPGAGRRVSDFYRLNDVRQSTGPWPPG